jgi:3-isopropylmalate/(R)-2-methylmalate dehydratase small subunit
MSELFRRYEAEPGPYRLTVDLEQCQVTDAIGFRAQFQMDDYRREALLKGLDEIGRTLLLEPKITAYERRRAALLARLEG